MQSPTFHSELQLTPDREHPPNSRNELFLALGILCVLILVPFWKLALMQGYIITDDIFASDIMNEGFPYRYVLSEVLKSGTAPLWMPSIYGGFPLLARAEAGAAYPLNLLLFGLLPPYTALNVTILSTLVIGALGMYLYVREIGGGFVGGLAGGFAFAFSGYMLSHLKHLANVNASCWLPLGLFLIERAFRHSERKYLVWLGLIFGLQHLSGHTQVAYYSGVLYIAYFLFCYRGKSGKQAPFWKPLVKNGFSWMFVGSMVLGSALGAVQLLPTYELVSLSQRSGGVTFEYASDYAYDPANLLMFAYPYVNGDIGDGTYTRQSIFWEDYGYVGLTVLLLGLYACRKSWKNRYVKFYAALFVCSLFLVLGRNTPVYEAVFYLVPGMKYFRFPTRFLLIADTSLIVLGAIGMTRLGDSPTMRSGKGKAGSGRIPRIPIFVGCLVVVDLLYFQLRQNPIVDADAWRTPPRTLAVLQADSGMFRLYVLGGNESHKMAFARARGWEGDLTPYIEQRDFLQPSSNALYGISTPDGYANLTPNYLVEVWGDQNRGGLVYRMCSLQQGQIFPAPAFSRLMRMYNVKYLFSLWPVLHGLELSDLGRKGEVFMYEVESPLPRAYLVSRTIPVHDIDDAKRLLLSGDFDPSREAMVYEWEDPHLPASDSLIGSVSIKSYTPNAVEFETRSNAQALLVFSDSYYPGWKAYVDGGETPVFQANITQRAIGIPPGDHEVMFVFRSSPAVVGLWVTLGSFVILLAYLVTKCRKEKATAGP